MFLKFIVAVIAEVSSIIVIIGVVVFVRFGFIIVVIASIAAGMLIADIVNCLFSFLSFM